MTPELTSHDAIITAITDACTRAGIFRSRQALDLVHKVAVQVFRDPFAAMMNSRQNGLTFSGCTQHTQINRPIQYGDDDGGSFANGGSQFGKFFSLTLRCAGGPSLQPFTSAETRCVIDHFERANLHFHFRCLRCCDAKLSDATRISRGRRVASVAKLSLFTNCNSYPNE